MKGEILVNHKEVYNRCAALTAFVESEVVGEAEIGYANIDQLLRQVDGATNAALIEAMKCNREKTVICARTLCKLLQFIDHASRELEVEDRYMAKDIASGARDSEAVSEEVEAQ